MEPLTRDHFDAIVAGLSTKEDIKELRTEMNTKFDALFELLDVREQVEKHEHDIQELKKALDLA